MIICAHLLLLGQLIGLAASFGPSQSMMLAVASSPLLGGAASREASCSSLSMLLAVCDMVRNLLIVPLVEVIWMSRIANEPKRRGKSDLKSNATGGRYFLRHGRN